MGIRKDENEYNGPPIFSGKAIRVIFPDLVTITPDNKQIKHKFEITTFPDWVHKVYLNEKFYEILGKDLEIGMIFTIDGEYIPIVDLEKEFLYHGILPKSSIIGKPGKIKQRYHCTKIIGTDNSQRWELREY